MKDKKIVTMQDISCMGQCSLTVALPVISAFGVETCIIPSAVLSTHTGGFEGYTFRDLSDDIPLIIDHWEKQGVVFDAVYTGYLGNVRQIGFASELKDKLTSEGALLIVDPAMADNGKLYKGFGKDYVSGMRGLCSRADIILPNITEAALLTGKEYVGGGYDEKYILSLLDGLTDLGAKSVILTGVSFDENLLGAAVLERDSKAPKYVYEERQEGAWHGTGDLFASAFVGAYLSGRTMVSAARTACRLVVESIKNTVPVKDEHWYGVKFERALAGLIESEAGRGKKPV